MLKEKVLNHANGNIKVNLKVRRDLHGRFKRAFVLADSKGRIHHVKATKRGAESKLDSLKKNTYYNDMTRSMTSCGAGLEIVKVKEDELLSVNSKQLWYNTLWQDFRSRMTPHIDDYKYIFQEHNISEDIQQMVKEMIPEIQQGTFSNIENLETNKIDVA